MSLFRYLPLAVLAACPAAAVAATAANVSLPPWTCAHPDALYSARFETGETAAPHDPSGGSGGAYPGAVTRILHIAGLGSGTQSYYLYLPTAYTGEHAWPLMFVLHGVAPYGGADGYAQTTRDNWAAIAETGDFIVAAPVANDLIDQNGSPFAVSWLVPPTSGPSDYDLFDAVSADVESAYNVERTRVYGWGFSAGGHVMYDLATSTSSTAFNASTMAAFGVGGADLAALACAGLGSTQCDQRLDALPRKIPLDIRIGNSDPNYPYAKSDHLRFVADGWVDHQTIFYNVFVGGHTYTVAQLGAIWGNLCTKAVTVR